MKKLLAILTVFGIVSCTNPSMEEGFERLNASLAELNAAVEALNIPQMQSDLEQMNATAAQMIIDAEALQGEWTVAMEAFADLQAMLDEMVADSESWATTEQMQDLLQDVREFGEGVDLLVLAADYDHDGVINAVDQCPDTPITEIGSVDSQGCAPGEKTGN